MSTSTHSNPAAADMPQVLLDHHLKQLRLPTFLREYDKLARQCASEQADYPHYLLRLSELELLDRERRATERHPSSPLSRGQESGDLRVCRHPQAQQVAGAGASTL